MANTHDIEMPDGTVLKDVPDTDEWKKKISEKVSRMTGGAVATTESVSDLPIGHRDVLTEGGYVDPTTGEIVQPGKIRTEAEQRAGNIIGVGSDWFYNRQPGVDYYTGIANNGFRADFSQMDTPEEEAKFLNERVGEGNWSTDEYGAYVLNKKGVEAVGGESYGYPVAIDEQRLSVGDIADLRGEALPVVGALAAGLATSGWSLFGSMLTVGATAMGFKAAQEATEEWGGRNLQSAWEVGLDVGEEGAWAMTGELGGRFASVVGRKIFSPHAAKVTPERRAAMQTAQARGFELRSSQITEAKLTGYAEGLWARVFGDRKALVNSRLIHEEMHNLKKAAGVGGLLAETGERMVGQVKRRTAAFNRLFERYTRQSKERVTKSISDFADSLSTATDDVGTAVRADIEASKRVFQEDARNLYRIIDETAGQRIYPTAALKAEARDQLARIQRTAQKEVPATGDEPARVIEGEPVVAPKEHVAQLNRILKLDDYIELDGAQEMRTVMRELSFSSEFLGNVSRRNSGKLLRALDDGLDTAEGGLPEEIAKRIKEARKFYADGIAVYDEAFIRRLMRDPSKTSIGPERVVEFLSKSPESVKSVRRVLEKTPEGSALWNSVKRARLDELIDSATDLEDNIIAGNFGKQLKGSQANRKAMREMFGDDYKELLRLERELSAFDGRIPASSLEAGDVKTAIIKAQKAQDAMKAFTQQDWVKQLGKTGAEFVTAVDNIFAPNKPLQIRAAKKLYGENSETWSRTRRVAMKKLLSTIVEESKGSPFESAFNGLELKKQLVKYGRESLDEMFGKDLTNDLFEFAENTRLVTFDPAKGAGGIVAAGLVARPLKNLGRLSQLWVAASLMSNRTGVRYLTEGFFSAQTRGGRATRESAAALARVYAQMGLLIDDGNGDLNEYFIGPEPPSPEQLQKSGVAPTPINPEQVESPPGVLDQLVQSVREISR